MKRSGIVACIGIVIGFFLVAMLVGTWESHYTRKGEVIAVENNVVTIEDTTGNLWDVESEEFTTGDSVEFLLFTSGTDSIITDDVIEEVRLVQ